MPLDPIVSLSVALAEAPGTCAFFLGSGVSRDAGVPTGWQVMREGLRKLQQLDATSAEPLDDDALDAWLAETGREHITYSELLELIAPDQAVRREYLAGFFEGREPGPTHEALADMAARSMIRVFITTNFDRLLEHALQARGIEPVVIASDADLEAAMPREHATCVVVKPHGDYLRETIRNTPEELATLDPGMTAELGEIFNRYGIVVVGYSGGDEGIGNILRARRSRFGVWWVARGELTPDGANLVEASAARIVRRDTAADFLADLNSRLRVFEEHPSGITPAVAHDSVMALLRAGDDIGLEETLRRERHPYEAELRRVTAEALADHSALSDDDVRAVWTKLRPTLERRLAGLLPLAVYAPDRFEQELRHLARALERRPMLGGLTMWIQLPEFAATWLAYVCGAVCTRMERLDSLQALLSSTWTDANNHENRLIWLPGETGHKFGEVLVDPPGGQRWLAPAWEFLTRSLQPLDWLHERYPEVTGEDEPSSSMSQFDVLVCIKAGLTEQRAAAYYSLAESASTAFAARLHRDVELRERTAEAVGVSLEEFDEKAPQALRDAAGFGGFGSMRSAADALETGNAW